MTKKKIQKIEAKDVCPEAGKREKKKRRVAAYARVSTERDEQSLSYETQISYYTSYISSNPEWAFVKVYADDGISGTGTKKRTAFNEMVADAIAGKIDLIITKSVSRFARNTLDSISTIRVLKEHGVECLFEKENLSSFDMKGEFMLTLMSSFAQEESRSISENIKWGVRKRYAEGHYGIAYSRFLGYGKGDEGPVIIPEEAEVIRYIYSRFLIGDSELIISRRLEKMGVLSPTKKNGWKPSTVTSILKNEKYYGAALLQKAFVEDFLTKKLKKNKGQLPQYFISDDHAGIVSKDVYDLAQQEFIKRTNLHKTGSYIRLFSGKIYCGECGGKFGSKTMQGDRPKYKKTIWACNNTYARKETCSTWRVDDSYARMCAEEAMRKRLASDDSVWQNVIRIIGKTIKDGKRYGPVTERLNAIRQAYAPEGLLFDDGTLRLCIRKIVVFPGLHMSIELIDGCVYEFEIPGRYGRINRPRNDYPAD